MRIDLIPADVLRQWGAVSPSAISKQNEDEEPSEGVPIGQKGGI